MARFTSRTRTDETAIDAASDGHAVRGESTSAGDFVAGVGALATWHEGNGLIPILVAMG